MMEHQRTILHLGLGAFHRAHQAVYLQRLHDRGDRSWRLASGNIRPGDHETIAALQSQHGTYRLETVTPAGERRYERIAALSEVVPYAFGIERLIAIGAHPDTSIISFTVTEGGYYLDAGDRLDGSAADIVADIEHVRHGVAGTTIYGALTTILRARRAAGAGPVTLLCCDNLRHNGTRSRSGLLQFLERIGDDASRQWVESQTTSPDGMVDRITPRSTPSLRGRVLTVTGFDDGAPVMAESFTQWVIEDGFAAGRPAWHEVGVELVGSVLPFEEAKIRILNATHSCIAWAGSLAGYRFIHEGMGDERIRRLAYDYVTNDVIPCLHPSPVDLHRYRDQVFERFGNAALADTNERVCADSYSKIRGFIAPTICERLARDEPIVDAAVLPALFLAKMLRQAHSASPSTIKPPGTDADALEAIRSSADPLQALCREPMLWGSRAGDQTLLAALRDAQRRVEALLPLL